MCRLLILFWLLPIASFSQLRIEHLTDNFYIYTTFKDLGGYRFPSNSMYLVTDAGVVLFDTPWDESQFQPLVDSIQKKHQARIAMVISTHYHDDRTAGLECFEKLGAQTYSSAKTHGLTRKFGEKSAAFTFVNDTTFTFGGYRFETFYPGEGHTADNLVIWFDRQKILYGGCLVKSVESEGLGNLADANLNDWQTTVERVRKKFRRPRYVIPGHFGWKHKGALEHTVKLLKQHKRNQPR